MITITQMDSFLSVPVNAGLLDLAWHESQIKIKQLKRVDAMRRARMLVLTSRYFALPAIDRKHRDRRIMPVALNDKLRYPVNYFGELGL